MDPEDLDVDFDFKSMLSNIDDPNSLNLDLLSPPPAVSQPQLSNPLGGGGGSAQHQQQQQQANSLSANNNNNRNGASAGLPLHPSLASRQQALSIGEMLDSRLFKPDAPWSIGSGRQGGLTAHPPPATFSSANGARGNRSNSGAVISTRLRAASDMHQQGFLTSEEKSLMKDLILSKNPRFKEEYANAERTNNWYSLQQFLRSFHNRMSPANSLSMAIDDLATEFEALATPPPPLPASHQQFGNMLADASAQAAGMTKSARKRMASQSTPVARPKKTTSSGKKEAAASSKRSASAAGVAPVTNSAPPSSVASPAVLSSPSPELESDLKETTPAGEKRERSTKPISQMDDKELEIEAAIAAAEGDQDAVAKIRKNERERRRRLAVSNGFDELFELLKLPQAAQIDKVSILRKAIDRIRELEERVKELEGA